MVTHTVLTARSMWEHSFHAEQTRRPRCPTLESPVGVCAGARVARQKPVTRVSGACGDRSAHRQPQALKGSSDGRPVNGDRAPSPGPADGTASRGDGAQGRCTGTGTDGRRRIVRAAPRAHSDIVDAHRWLWVRVVNRAGPGWTNLAVGGQVSSGSPERSGDQRRHRHRAGFVLWS